MNNTQFFLILALIISLKIIHNVAEKIVYVTPSSKPLPSTWNPYTYYKDATDDESTTENFSKLIEILQPSKDLAQKSTNQTQLQESFISVPLQPVYPNEISVSTSIPSKTEIQTGNFFASALTRVQETIKILGKLLGSRLIGTLGLLTIVKVSAVIFCHVTPVCTNAFNSLFQLQKSAIKALRYYWNPEKISSQ